MRLSRMWLSILIVAATLVGVPQLPSQSFEVLDGNIRLTSLDGLWRFHIGDDPQWANPNFDDSQWPLLRSDQDWARQGYKGYGGMAWYRFKVVVPAGVDQAALYLPEIRTCYEVYADGRLAGVYGKMPPNRFRYAGGGDSQVYRLPNGKNRQQKIAIAVRVWHWPGWARFYGGGPQHGGGLAGDAAEIDHRNDLDHAYEFRSAAAGGIIGSLCILSGIVGLILFFLRRNEQLYLWFGLSLLFSGISVLAVTYSIGLAWSVVLHDLAVQTLWTVSDLAYLAFFLKLLQPRRNWVLKLAAVSVSIRLLFYVITSISGPDSGAGLMALLPSLLDLIVNGCIVTVVVTAAIENSVDARLLAAPVVLQMASNFLSEAGETTYTLGWQQAFDGTIRLTKIPFPIDFVDVAGVLLPLSLLGILIHRFARTRSEEERYAGEFESARSVQQFLIPEHLPNTPGLRIESEYRPAREVGGDFFQVIPNAADGSTLIVVGDVAGHGLKSGMLATLIVGSIRTATTFTTDPSRVMMLLNERLQGRGLVTCLTLRIESDGATSVVNAGHLPPYLNGHELAIEGSLPLGAIPGIEFPILHINLAKADSLMLMTDGVAEAQDDKGRLFGFDRIAEMLRKGTSAAALASAAQAFGQDDDITVLTLAIAPVEAAHA